MTFELRAIALGAAAIAILTSCSSVQVIKVTGNTQPEGIPFYLPRPYVQVFEPFVIGSKAYLVSGKLSPNGKYLLSTTRPTSSDGAPQVRPRKGRATPSAREHHPQGGLAASGTRPVGRGPGRDRDPHTTDPAGGAGFCGFLRRRRIGANGLSVQRHVQRVGDEHDIALPAHTGPALLRCGLDAGLR